MHEAPAGPDLLDAARRILLDELLPALPPEKHYAALMTANAIAIAARVARENPSVAGALAARAWGLLGGEGRASGDPGSWRELAAAIRAGRFDPGTDEHHKAYELLRAYAEA